MVADMSFGQDSVYAAFSPLNRDAMQLLNSLIEFRPRKATYG